MKSSIPSILKIAAITAVLGVTPVHADGHGHDHSAQNAQTIVDIAAGNDSFETLVAAVIAAGLAETLNGEGPFTVFAPTDEAFAALPEGTLASLLEPANKDKLVAILTYHVVPGAVTAAQVAGLSEAKTVQGESVSVKAGKDGVMIDSARVVQADIKASNGIIHVIDKVILPKS